MHRFNDFHTTSPRASRPTAGTPLWNRFDWESTRSEVEQQVTMLRETIQQSPGYALGSAALAGFVLGWIMKR